MWVETTPAETKVLSASTPFAAEKRTPLTLAAAQESVRQYIETSHVKQDFADKGHYAVVGYTFPTHRLVIIKPLAIPRWKIFAPASVPPPYLAWEIQVNPVVRELHSAQATMSCLTIYLDAYTGDVISEYVTSISM